MPNVVLTSTVKHKTKKNYELRLTEPNKILGIAFIRIARVAKEYSIWITECSTGEVLPAPEGWELRLSKCDSFPAGIKFLRLGLGGRRVVRANIVFLGPHWIRSSNT